MITIISRDILTDHDLIGSEHINLVTFFISRTIFLASVCNTGNAVVIERTRICLGSVRCSPDSMFGF